MNTLFKRNSNKENTMNREAKSIVKSKMFKRNEFDKVNNYHGRMQSAWGKGIKKVVTKTI